jgi:hypothetical protein
MSGAPSAKVAGILEVSAGSNKKFSQKSRNSPSTKQQNLIHDMIVSKTIEDAELRSVEKRLLKEQMERDK